MFDQHYYIPCLRWKTGEYQAIKQLSDTTKKMLIPLIEIPQMGWDFEENREKKTIDDHLEKFPKRVFDKWGTASCFIDIKHISPTKRMMDGNHPIKFVFDSLNKLKCSAVPVTGLERDNEYQREIKAILKEKKASGICFRLTLDQAYAPTFKSNLDSLLSTLEIEPNDCNLILDLISPNFIPLDGFSKVILQIVESLAYLSTWGGFSILGTSFPETMGGIAEGIKILPRYEWQLYKKLIEVFNGANLRLPAFGDYAILHPSARDDLDWRKMRTSPNIRHTIDDNWCIVRGKSYRERKLVLEQYFELSQQLIRSQYYGQDVSWGDEYIKKCAGRTVGHGSLTTWRQVGTNQHIEKVAQDISSFYASLGSS